MSKYFALINLVSIFTIEITFLSIKLSDLDIKQEISTNSFGSIKLVSLNKSYVKKLPTTTFALKCSSKQLLSENGFLHCVETEVDLISKLRSPFIVQFLSNFEDNYCIYYLLENVHGKGLNRIIEESYHLPEEKCRLYAASMILALEGIHSHKIAYRWLVVSLYILFLLAFYSHCLMHLKPENIVIDSNDHLKLMNFEFATKVDRGKTFSLCGAPDYLAPEIINNEGHDWGKYKLKYFQN